jgi:serine/threonine protein kinase
VISNSVVYVGGTDKNLYAIGANETVRQQARINELKEKGNKLLTETEQLVQVPASIKTNIQAQDEPILECAFKELESLRTNAKPVLALTFNHTNFIANRWHKISVPISNTGISPAFNVTLSFSEGFEVKRLQAITIEAGKSTTVEIDILSRKEGMIPFEITLDYQDATGNLFKDTQVFWIDFVEKDMTVTTDPAFSPVGQFTPPSLTPKEFPLDLSDRYTESEFIGKGEFAHVFKAKRKDGQFVAVRIPISLDESTGKSCIAELQNWIRLDHRNIVKVYNFNIMPSPYFEMELCDSSLAVMEKPIESVAAARILFNICEGLKFMHAKKIIHRDLKPQNILLKNGVPKISDWGLSHVITGSILTPSAKPYTSNYEAPEQIDRKAKDEQTDIWQLGIIFYELVTGVLPFTGDTVSEIVACITTKNPQPTSLINPSSNDVESIIMKCLERNPSNRYLSVIELQKDLALYLGITYKESLKESLTAKDPRRSVFYCGELVKMSISIGDIKSADKYLRDLVHYSKGDVKAQAKELSEQIEMRMKMGITEIPDELIQKVEFIVHQVSVGFRKRG